MSNAALNAFKGADLSNPVNVTRQYLDENTYGSYEVKFVEAKFVDKTKEKNRSGFVFNFDITESNNDNLPVGTGCTISWWLHVSYWETFMRRFIKQLFPEATEEELADPSFLASMVGDDSPLVDGISKVIVSENSKNTKFPNLQWTPLS